MDNINLYGRYLAAALVLTFIPASPARAQQADDALVDALAQEGLLTHDQAEWVRAKIEKVEDSTPASKIALSDSVKALQFYGDGRLRYENIDQHNHYDAVSLNDRERYRLRIGADYTYSDHFKAGFELESANTGDSANQTFGGMFTKASINVGKIYLRYDPTDWLSAYAGKFTNPWYTTTDIVYSTDLNPEGGAEIFTFHPTDNLTLGLNAVQYLYIDANEGASTPGLSNNDVQIIGNQIPVTWKITKDVTFKGAPGFTFYTGGGNTNYGTAVPVSFTTSGTTGTVFAATANTSSDPVFMSPREADDLAVVSFPGEFDFKIADVPIRPYWDFEWNTEGRERVQHVYLDPTASAPGAGTAASVAAKNGALGDNVAWAAGVQVGQNKKKGDWSGLAEFRQIGLGAVDQNINGTDYADSYANQEGFKFSTAYNFTDFLLATITFYDTWDYKKGLYQSLGGTAAAPTAGTTQYLVSEKSLQRVQVDLGWKF
jgi:hypothetical protein